MSRESLVATVTGIDGGWAYTYPNIQNLRLGVDAPSGLKVGDKVALSYGRTSYGYGWSVTAIIISIEPTGNSASGK